jgi:hypothetical protein
MWWFCKVVSASWAGLQLRRAMQLEVPHVRLIVLPLAGPAHGLVRENEPEGRTSGLLGDVPPLSRPSAGCRAYGLGLPCALLTPQKEEATGGALLLHALLLGQWVADVVRRG